MVDFCRLGPSKRKRSTATGADQDYGKVDEDADAHENVVDYSDEYIEEQKLLLYSQSKEDLERIEKETIGQSHNTRWFEERLIRLTASNFGPVVTRRDENTWIVLAKRIVESPFKGDQNTRWGAEKEDRAKKHFEDMTDLQVTDCGLFVHSEHQFLGASPDGLVGEDAIIEIKCPASIKDLAPEDAIHQKKVRYMTVDKGSIMLRRSHKYFYQIQGQLAIADKERCYFIIWTPKGMFVETIDRDIIFWETNMLPKLIRFFETFMFPLVLNKK